MPVIFFTLEKKTKTLNSIINVPYIKFDLDIRCCSEQAHWDTMLHLNLHLNKGCALNVMPALCAQWLLHTPQNYILLTILIVANCCIIQEMMASYYLVNKQT